MTTDARTELVCEMQKSWLRQIALLNGFHEILADTGPHVSVVELAKTLVALEDLYHQQRHLIFEFVNTYHSHAKRPCADTESGDG